MSDPRHEIRRITEQELFIAFLLTAFLALVAYHVLR